MTRFAFLMTLLAGFITALAAAQTAAAAPAENQAGAVLCEPGVYQRQPDDCLAQGPSAYLTRMAEIGLELPMRPLPATRPSSELVMVDNLYARVVNDTGAPVFATLEDAVRGEPVATSMPPGFEFVTYIDRAEVGGRIYYMVDPGAWMRGGDMSRISAMPSFQGLQFQRTPAHSFGWVLFETRSKRTPGYLGEDYTGRVFYRYNQVPIYAVQEQDGQEWVLIGPDEWLEGRHVAGVTPNPVPPSGVETGRWVEINLAEQTLAIYENRRLVFATVMSSGVPGQWTQPGLFQAYKKKAQETMSGSFTADRSDYYYLEGVPWTVYFDQARALHGTYWHNSFGVPTSRGCVNLSPGDAHWVFDWINEGDWIYVWDPSGATPTDPALYGSGGA